MAPRRFDFRGILRTFKDFDVEFIVVGGVSAVLNGAPISTFDLDLVHARTSENIDRLQKALTQLDAKYRFGPYTNRAPDSSHLSSSGHQLLTTRLGPLDVLGSIGNNRDYNDLLADSLELEIESGHRIRVLKLEALIDIKRQLGQEKDLAVLPVLERTARENAGKK